MWQAVRVATKLEGPRGLFRGTVATLSREVPFYVLGIVFFEQFQRAAKGVVLTSCHASISGDRKVVCKLGKDEEIARWGMQVVAQISSQGKVCSAIMGGVIERV